MHKVLHVQNFRDVLCHDLMSVGSEILQACYTLGNLMIHEKSRCYHIRHALHVHLKFARANHVISNYIVIMYRFAPRFYRLAVSNKKLSEEKFHDGIS